MSNTYTLKQITLIDDAPYKVALNMTSDHHDPMEAHFFYADGDVATIEGEICVDQMTEALAFTTALGDLLAYDKSSAIEITTKTVKDKTLKIYKF